MKRKAIAIMDVLVSLIIITIIGIMISKYVVGVLDINRQIDLKNKFSEISTVFQNSLENRKNIFGYIVTPRGVFSPDTESFDVSGDTIADFYEANDNVIYFNYEKALYGKTSNGDNEDNTDLFKNIYNFTVYNLNEDYSNKKEKQKQFLGIPEGTIAKYGDVPLVFVIQRYAEYYGYRYPYKIFTIVDIGPFLFKKLKTYMANAENPKDVELLFEYLFPVTENGVTVRKIINFDKLKKDNSDLYDALTEMLGTMPEKTWNENKRFIQISVINTMPVIEKIVSNTYNNLYTIEKNVEDWAVIQARIAAYDSLNGNSMDKDYFITCTGNGCDDADVDKTRTLKPDLSDDTTISHDDTGLNANDISNGFFVCTENITTESGYVKGYKCSDGTVPYVIYNDCEHLIKRGTEDEITVTGATPIDVPANDGSENTCLLGNAARKLLNSNAFSSNFFGFPVFFSNGGKVNITAEFDGLYNNTNLTGTNGVYKITLNIPKTGGIINNPPYTATVFTIFPWYLGGIESSGDTKNDYYINTYNGESSGFGVMNFPIFAHIF